VNPTAFSIARAGARLGPSVIVPLLRFPVELMLAAISLSAFIACFMEQTKKPTRLGGGLGAFESSLPQPAFAKGTTTVISTSTPTTSRLVEVPIAIRRNVWLEPVIKWTLVQSAP
jgi:hypothetical protein